MNLNFLNSNSIVNKRILKKNYNLDMFGNINSFLNSITSLDFESYSNKTDWFSKLSTGRRQSLIKHISTKIQNQYRDNTIVQKEITSIF
jgi:hypothetical protein